MIQKQQPSQWLINSDALNRNHTQFDAVQNGRCYVFSTYFEKVVDKACLERASLAEKQSDKTQRPENDTNNKSACILFEAKAWYDLAEELDSINYQAFNTFPSDRDVGHIEHPLANPENPILSPCLHWYSRYTPYHWLD